MLNDRNPMFRHLRRALVPAVLVASLVAPAAARAHDTSPVPTCGDIYRAYVGHDATETNMVVKIWIGDSNPALLAPQPAFLPNCANVRYQVTITPTDGSDDVYADRAFTEVVKGVETSSTPVDLTGRVYSELDIAGASFPGGLPTTYNITVRALDGTTVTDTHTKDVGAGSGGGGTFF